MIDHGRSHWGEPVLQGQPRVGWERLVFNDVDVRHVAANVPEHHLASFPGVQYRRLRWQVLSIVIGDVGVVDNDGLGVLEMVVFPTRQRDLVVLAGEPGLDLVSELVLPGGMCHSLAPCS
jgi:hypothetical protein